MSDILFSYQQSRVHEKKIESKKKPGPVITISREYGCPAKTMAARLVALLNETRVFETTWQFISGDLLEEAAKELKVSPDYIQHVFSYDDRNAIDEILAATRKDSLYRSDHQIKMTIGRVIRSIGEKGHMVIVGRGGVAHTSHIKDSLHIRLQADIEYRIERVAQSHQCSVDQARKLVYEGDLNRNKFLQYYLGEPCCNKHFDVIFNCQTIDLGDTVEIVRNLLLKKLKTN